MSGVLPPGWRRASIRQIATVITGATPSTKNSAFFGGPYPFVTPGDLSEGTRVFTADRSLSEAGAARVRLLPRGSILVTCIGALIGKIGIAEVPLATNQQINAMVPKDDSVSGEYIAQAMLHSRRRLERLAGTQAVPIVNKSTLEAFEIDIPPRPEQDRIVEILTTWDRGVTVAESLVAAAALHVSGKTSKHLDTFIPGTVREDTTLPLILLGDAFDERGETGHENEPLLSITGERGVVPREEIERRDTSAEDKGNYRLILPGDIGYNTMRMWQGVCGLSALRGIVSPAYTVVTPRPEVMDGAFAAALFKAPHMIEWLRRYSQGIVDDTLNLKFEQFRQIRIRLPSLETQRRVANAIHAIRAEADVTARLASKLREQKQALMTRLLSGALRVPLRKAAEQAVAETAHA